KIHVVTFRILADRLFRVLQIELPGFHREERPMLEKHVAREWIAPQNFVHLRGRINSSPHLVCPLAVRDLEAAVDLPAQPRPTTQRRDASTRLRILGLLVSGSEQTND